jgi:hypothetical protein
MSLLPRAGWMLAAHIAAALVVGAWLRWGERRFFAAASRWAEQARDAIELAIAFVFEALIALRHLASDGSPAGRIQRVDAPPSRSMTGRILSGGLALRGPPTAVPA